MLFVLFVIDGAVVVVVGSGSGTSSDAADCNTGFLLGKDNTTITLLVVCFEGSLYSVYTIILLTIDAPHQTLDQS